MTYLVTVQKPHGPRANPVNHCLRAVFNCENESEILPILRANGYPQGYEIVRVQEVLPGMTTVVA